MTSPDESPAVRLSGVTKRFGSLVAVDRVDLEVARGEVYGFLGPNGAGKSTLLRVMMGLMAASEGEVEVLGLRMPAQADELRRLVGYMPQRFALYEDLSVEENLEFAAEVYAIRMHRERVRQTLDEYNLVDRRAQRPATLSGGWKQRLALAAANIHRPRLLVLDEPTAGVDPENRRLFWDKLFELSAAGTTILVSTHYMDEAVRCYRLCMMRDGARAAEGRPLDFSAALSGRVLRFRLERLVAGAAALRAAEHVASVAQIGSTVRVLLRQGSPPPGVMLERLGAQLDADGLGPVEGGAVEADMEDVFAALIQGEHLGDEPDRPPDAGGVAS